MFVVVLNGVKDFFEDFKRKKSDDEENNKESFVFDDSKGKFERKKWSEIKLGDIIKVFKDEYFPADLVLINTSEKNGECFIETKNLDGETNLKFKQSHSDIRLFFQVESSLSNFSGILRTQKPNQHIYEFDAVIQFNSIAADFAKTETENHKFLRTRTMTFERNNNFDIDIVYNNNNNYYNNDESEYNTNNKLKNENSIDHISENQVENQCTNNINLNANSVLSKENLYLHRSLTTHKFPITSNTFSDVLNNNKNKQQSKEAAATEKTPKQLKDEVIIDKSAFFKQIFIILLVQIFLSVIACIFYYFWLQRQNGFIFYIFPSSKKFIFDFKVFVQRVGTWVLIFTNLVPISLLVTLEMIKYVQGMYICWDIEMYDQEKHIPAKVQTSTLNEELGQVKVINFYVFYFFEK